MRERVLEMIKKDLFLFILKSKIFNIIFKSLLIKVFSFFILILCTIKENITYNIIS